MGDKVRPDADITIRSVTSFADADAGPYGVAVGLDDAIWLTLVHSGQVARLRPDGGMDVFDLGAPDCRPMIITAGPDAMWFTRSGDDRIGRITADGEQSSFALAVGSGPYGIVAGPDGCMWFTQMGGNSVGRIDRRGRIETVGLFLDGAFPAAITAAPDGALWCALNQADAIARVSVQGDVRTYALPTPKSAPVGIAADDATVWFAELHADRIGRIAMNGDMVEFPLPGPSPKPHAVAADRRGGCWFTAWGTSQVGHVDEFGTTVLYDLPAASEPHGLIVGRDGAVWVALENEGVARLAVRDHPGRGVR